MPFGFPPLYFLFNVSATTPDKDIDWKVHLKTLRHCNKKTKNTKNFLNLHILLIYMDVTEIHKRILDGDTLSQIAKTYGCSYTTIVNHLKRANLYDSLIPLIRERWTNGAIASNRKPIKIIKNTSFYYLVGVYYGDGYASKILNKQYPSTNTWKFGLKTIDYDFAKAFSHHLQNSMPNSNPTSKQQGITKSNKPIFMCEVYNQDIGIALSKYTKPYSNQLELTHEAARAFLKGMFDSEGSICLNKQHKCCGIRLGNTDQKLAKYIKHLLLVLFNIQTNISQSKTPLGKPYYIIGIYKKEYRDIFKNKIGFSIVRKQSML